jgi:hypothetical protein
MRAPEGPAIVGLGMNGALPAGSPFISSFVPVQKNVQVVLLRVSNRIAFRRVPRRRAVGKNTTVFVKRANRDRKLFVSRARARRLNRTNGMGRPTSLIPEAPALQAWGVVTCVTIRDPFALIIDSFRVIC